MHTEIQRHTLPYELTFSILADVIGKNIHEFFEPTHPKKPRWDASLCLPRVSKTFRNIVFELLTTAFGELPEPGVGISFPLAANLKMGSLKGFSRSISPNALAPVVLDTPFMESYRRYLQAKLDLERAHQTSAERLLMSTGRLNPTDDICIAYQLCIKVSPRELSCYLQDAIVREMQRGRRSYVLATQRKSLFELILSYSVLTNSHTMSDEGLISFKKRLVHQLLAAQNCESEVHEFLLGIGIDYPMTTLTWDATEAAQASVRTLRMHLPVEIWGDPAVKIALDDVISQYHLEYLNE